MKIAAYGELSLHVSVVPTHAPAPADRQFLLRGVDMEVGGSPHYVAAQASAQGDSVLLVGTVAPDPASTAGFATPSPAGGLQQRPST